MFISDHSDFVVDKPDRLRTHDFGFNYVELFADLDRGPGFRTMVDFNERVFDFANILPDGFPASAE